MNITNVDKIKEKLQVRIDVINKLPNDLREIYFFEREELIELNRLLGKYEYIVR